MARIWNLVTGSATQVGRYSSARDWWGMLVTPPVVVENPRSVSSSRPPGPKLMLVTGWEKLLTPEGEIVKPLELNAGGVPVAKPVSLQPIDHTSLALAALGEPLSS